MDIISKASYTSYILGKAMLKSLDIAVHEMRVSKDKKHLSVISKNQKDRLKLHQTFIKLFAVAEARLTEKDKENINEEVLMLVGDLWD